MGVLPGSSSGGGGPSGGSSGGSSGGPSPRSAALKGPSSNANHTPLGGPRPPRSSSSSAVGVGVGGAAEDDSGGGGGGGGSGSLVAPEDFDGKRPRKSVMRKTVDYNSSFMGLVELRIWQRGVMGSGSSGDGGGPGDLRRDRRALQPDVLYYPELVPPSGCRDNSANAITTRFVKTATNKVRCPVFTLAWTPEGRRLITGASSGEFTLWNGLTFNFETILQAHDSAVRTMKWSHNESWMVTGDHGGYIKYWQSNMNNVKMFQAHKDPVRDIAFSPTDAKFASCSDDGTVRIWDFLSCSEERVLRGHGSDVKCVDWHPSRGIVASGSRDNQQPIKLWDPRSGSSLATLHAHKATVMDLRWNTNNGNWLLTASRDHLVKVFDVRNIRAGVGSQGPSTSASSGGASAGELQTFRGHKKEASALAWHPVHEGIFTSGGSDGAVLFWSVGSDKEIGSIDFAHDSIVWALAWHPVGHILCTGSNDHTCKYWTRNRPGDAMRDKYNNVQQQQSNNQNNHNHLELDSMLSSSSSSGAQQQAIESGDLRHHAIIPGMAPEDRVAAEERRHPGRGPPRHDGSAERRPGGAIPGLGDSASSTSSMSSSRGSGSSSHHQHHSGSRSSDRPSYQQQQEQNYERQQQQQHQKAKTPYAKPIPKSFQASWNHEAQQQQQTTTFDEDQQDCISLQELQRQATAVVAFGNVYPVLPGSNLSLSILSGEMAVKDILRCEFLT